MLLRIDGAAASSLPPHQTQFKNGSRMAKLTALPVRVAQSILVCDSAIRFAPSCLLPRIFWLAHPFFDLLLCGFENILLMVMMESPGITCHLDTAIESLRHNI